ncbi:M56 family metallopeptidase [Singulisphaera rosea]
MPNPVTTPAISTFKPVAARLNGPSPVDVPVIDTAIETTAKKAWRFDVTTTLVFTYLLITTSLAARLIGSLAAVVRLKRTSRPIDNGPWQESLGRWKDRLGISRRVRLARTSDMGVPAVIGAWSPTILLPETIAGSTSARTIDAILLHELAHVRRGDYGWNLTLRILQAIYWPNPLAWILGKIVAGVREQACDDLCIYYMGGPSDYRATLLDVAQSLVRRPGPALGMAMTRSSKLDRRLTHIAESRGTARCLLRGPGRFAIALALVLATGTLGSVRLARTAGAAISRPSKESAAKPRPVPEKSILPTVKADTIKSPVAKTSPKDEPAQPERLVAQYGGMGGGGGGGFGGGIDPNLLNAQMARTNEQLETPVQVTVVTPKLEEIPTSVTEECILLPIESVNLNSKVSGILSSKDLASVAERVKRGAVLARIEITDLPAQRAEAQRKARKAQAEQLQAKAKVRLAEAVFAEKQDDTNPVKGNENDPNFQELVKAAQKAAATAVLKAEAELRAAEAEELGASASLDSAKEALAILQESSTMNAVTSPIDGVILRCNQSAGAVVNRNDEQHLFIVARTDVLIATITVPEVSALLVDLDDPVQFTVRSLGEAPIVAKVLRIAAEIQEGFLAVTIAVPNADGRFRPGTTGKANLVLGPPHKSLSLPLAAFRLNQAPTAIGSSYCYRVSDGRAVLTPVRIGQQFKGRIEVLEGLNDDDLVITYTALNGHVIPRGNALAPGRGTIAQAQRVEIVDLPQPKIEDRLIQWNSGGMGGGPGGGRGGMGGGGFR